jgi:predicted DNA-binding transcriptional regulator AlpA
MKNERQAYNIAEFCEAFRVSRSELYRLWKTGTGPKRLRIGRKSIITVEAAQDWASKNSQPVPPKPPKPKPEEGDNAST